MQKVQSSSLLSRSDTMFGVCQGLGEDFGFNPNWLRVAFALMVVFNVGLALAAYAATAVVVLAVRLLVPNRRSVAAIKPATLTVAAEAPAEAAVAVKEEAPTEQDRILVAA